MSLGRINRPGAVLPWEAHLEGLRDPRDDLTFGPDGNEITFYRCDGALICWDCWRPYYNHKHDPDADWLTVLCNGWRVKL